jgi:hypothetical protein
MLLKQREIRENENYFLNHAESGNEAVPPQSTLFEGSALREILLYEKITFCCLSLHRDFFFSYSNYEGGVGEDRLLIFFKSMRYSAPDKSAHFQSLKTSALGLSSRKLGL